MDAEEVAWTDFRWDSDEGDTRRRASLVLGLALSVALVAGIMLVFVGPSDAGCGGGVAG